ncbi:MAG TPA: penicillin-binding transpeptidase domain-containing protein [Vicinamibacteria bacterium]|nr:penicillin-binding transpeptidase domain-containing protein [Vicinamibacteria bacterium]
MNPGRARTAALLILTVTPAQHVLARPSRFFSDRRECVLLLPLDAQTPYVTDPDECAVPTAPASTFKIPHALIALDTGIVSDPLERVAWDGKTQPFATWERDHSLDSAMKSSVVWFFQRTASLIGPERMRESLKGLEYAKDSFEDDVTWFWLNGDLVVSPDEQLRFLRRLVRFELPVERQIVDAVKAAFTMPPGKITNAAGIHDFGLSWPGIHVLRAKTGFTRVGDERVSWIVGHIETDSREYVFVSRVRAQEDLSPTAGIDLTLRVLNSRGP